MKILSHNEGLLTNAEIRLILLEKDADKTEAQTALPSEKKLYKYLMLQARERATSSKIRIFKERAMNDFQVTEAEVLQLINLCPDSELEVPLIIENCEDRLTEEQLEQLVQLLKDTLQ